MSYHDNAVTGRLGFWLRPLFCRSIQVGLRDPANDTPERRLVGVRAVLARCVDELLSLALAVVGGCLALWHGASGWLPSLTDLHLTVQEVRHG